MSVYLIEHELGPVKIGRSNSPVRRLNDLDVGPYQLRLIGILHSDDSAKLESELHIRFQNKKIRGEWFALDVDDVEYIFNEYDPGNEVYDPSVVSKNPALFRQVVR